MTKLLKNWAEPHLRGSPHVAQRLLGSELEDDQAVKSRWCGRAARQRMGRWN